MIVGKQSNLSSFLGEKLEGVRLISARDASKEIENIQVHEHQPVNIVFNNFQPSRQLNNLEKPSQYVDAAIGNTGEILELLLIHGFNINKILYTSSSSVYGDNIFCKETDALKPKSLHAALKVANEKLIEKFCVDNGISYAIIRLFNMYGGHDKFSVVSKIINAFKNKKDLSIVNQGNAIRDFIYINDVANVYQYLLDAEVIPNIINIGTGTGNSVRGIIDFIENKGFHLNVVNCKKDEIKVSTANIEVLSDMYSFKMMDVKEYILMKLDEE